jgi:hypothetical protein
LKVNLLQNAVIFNSAQSSPVFKFNEKSIDQRVLNDGNAYESSHKTI